MGGGGADEGFKRAKTQGVTHLCRRNDGDPSQQGGYKEAVSAWEVLNTPIHHANTILQTPPSSGAVGFSFTQQEIHLGRRRRAGEKDEARSAVPSDAPDDERRGHGRCHLEGLTSPAANVR